MRTGTVSTCRPARPSLGRRLHVREESALLRRHDARHGHPAEHRECARARRAGRHRSRPITSRRPAASRADSPAGRYLVGLGVQKKDFNSYGSRRGNHEVMVRGTFANIRLRNRWLPAPRADGRFTCRAVSRLSIYDAAMRYQKDQHTARDPRGQGIRRRVLARLGGQGHGSARRARRDRRELRAHTPLEPHRHGRRAPAVSTTARPPKASA